VGEGLAVINQALDGGADARQFARQVVQYLRDLLLLRMGAGGLLEPGGEALEEMRRQAGEIAAPALLEAIRAFGQAAVSGRESWQPALRLELALVESLFPTAADTGSSAAPQSTGWVAPRNRVAEAPASPGGPEAARPAAQPAPEARAKGERPAPASDVSPVQSERPAPASDAAPAHSERPAMPTTVSPAQSKRPATASATPPTPGPLTFQAVLDRWPELLQAAQERDIRIQALLADCKPLGLENRRLVLGFRSELRREKIEKKHNQATLAAALKQVFGQELGVRCIMLHDGGGRVGDPPASLALEEGGMVATALRDLGAQVVTVEPVPPSETQDTEPPDPGQFPEQEAR
jgi:DNA polymerase-3 subunit gamma/tau